MASAPDAEDADGDADADERAARADLYAVLSQCWREPTPKLVEAIETGALESVVPGADADFEELRAEHTRLFVGPGAVPAQPYESVHRDGESEDGTGPVLGPSTEAVERWYREYGLSIDPDWVEMPDHVATELEFVAYLLSADEPAAAGQFLDEHLRVWLPGFLDDVATATELSFYATLAETTRAVLDRPVDTLGDN